MAIDVANADWNSSDDKNKENKIKKISFILQLLQQEPLLYSSP
jgi:hypothetical protein